VACRDREVYAAGGTWLQRVSEWPVRQPRCYIFNKWLPWRLPFVQVVDALHLRAHYPARNAAEMRTQLRGRPRASMQVPAKPFLPKRRATRKSTHPFRGVFARHCSMRFLPRRFYRP
jgi:hypothetical protein